MLDPFNSPSRDYFGQSRFSDTNAQDADMQSRLVGGVMQNNAYVSAAKRADEYRRRAAEAAQGSRPSVGSQIGGAVAGAATGAAVTGIIGLI
jgi:hypothetical protein